MNTALISVDVYLPGAPWPVRLREFAEFSGRRRFAVYRPAYSSRGGTINDTRRVYDDLSWAWSAAHKPLPAAVRARWNHTA